MAPTQSLSALLNRKPAKPWTPEENGFVITPWGRPGAGKTAFAFSGPAPIVVFDFNWNTSQEIRRWPDKEILDPYTYRVHELGDRQANVDMWNRFLSDYNRAIDTFMKSGLRGTIVIDDVTRLWELIRFSLVPLNPDGTVKTAWSYGPANFAYQSLFQKARAAKVVLFAIVQAKNVWVSEMLESGKTKTSKTDAEEADWKDETPGMSDVVVWVSRHTQDGKTVRRYFVKKCNPNGEVDGSTFETPEELTYDKLVEAIQTY